jgi:predicted Zn-dependent protease
MELEADHVGLYLIARAGYDPRIAARLLERLAIAQPEMGRAKPNHPTFSSRFEALQEVIEEINRKRASGSRLVPTLPAKRLTRNLS